MALEFIKMKLGMNPGKLESVTPKQAEEKMRAKDGGVLAEDEHLILAYKLDSHKLYFTDRRIIVKSAPEKTSLQKVMQKRKRKQTYNSIPYDTVGAWEIQTAGAMDADCELLIHTSSGSETISLIEKDLLKSKVNLNHIAKVLNHFCLPGGSEEGEVVSPEVKTSNMGGQGMRDFLGGNAVELDSAEVEKKFKDMGVLHSKEQVKLAYRSGRDTTLFTTKRMLFIDVKGLISKRVCYTSILYKHVRLYEIQTGAESIFDSDAEFWLYTDLVQFPFWQQDVKKSLDLNKLQGFLTDITCGTGFQTYSNEGSTASMGGGDVSGWEKMFGGDGVMGQVSAAEANTMFHTAPNNILQPNEYVEMALKGKKDFWLFTTKRMIFVDHQSGGLFGGKKVAYLSVPYGSISHFAIQTPGGGVIFKDTDAELQIWTDSCQMSEDKDGKVTAGVNFLEQKLSPEKCDLVQIHRYLSEKVLSKVERPENPFGRQSLNAGWLDQAPPKTAALVPKKAKFDGSKSYFNVMASMFTDNHKKLDADTIEKDFREKNMLQQDEKVVYAFAHGRDLFMLTTKRIFMMDAQGWNGKRVQFLSIPYSSVESFNVSTASKFDSDCEICFDLKSWWPIKGVPSSIWSIDSKVEIDLKKCKDVNMVEIFRFLSEQCVAHYGEEVQNIDLPEINLTATSERQRVENNLANLISFFDRDNAKMYSSDELVELNKDLESTLLLQNEKVELGFSIKKDMILFTNLRLLYVDHSKKMLGLGGSSYTYESTSWKAAQGFGFRMAGGFFDADSEMWIFRSGTFHTFEFDIKKGTADQSVINEWLNQKILVSRKPEFGNLRLSNVNLYNVMGEQPPQNALPTVVEEKPAAQPEGQPQTVVIAQ